MIKTFIIQAIAAAIAVLLATKLMPRVRVRRMSTAVTVAVVFALLNLLLGWLVKAVLAVVLIPVAIVTLGLPYLVLGLIANTVLLYLTDAFVDDFEIDGFWPTLGTATLVTVAAWLLPRFI